MAIHSITWRYYITRPRRNPPALEFIAAAEAIMFTIAALLTPAVIYAARRFPLYRRTWYLSTLAHLAAGSAFALTVKLVWDVAMLPLYRTPWIGGAFSWSRMLSSAFDGFQVNLLLYWIVVIGVTAINEARRSRESAIEAAELHALLAEARLETLRTQLDPHFLFNTLHSISALIQTDPDSAELTVANLSELLRRSLEQRGRPQILLEAEIEFIRLYLEIQCLRFQERLHVAYDIQPDVQGALVPGMILQPLVENSIRHAIAPRASGGELLIGAHAERGELHVVVEDFGGTRVEAPEFEGVGLRNTRERLAALYPGAHRITIGPGESGLRVRIVIPLQMEEALEPREALADHYRG